MKKLILVFVAVAITAGAYAQADSTLRKSSPNDINNVENQNLQNNPEDLNNTQKQNTKNNPQDLNRNQNQNMQSNPQDLNQNQKPNLQNNPVDQSQPDGVVMQNGKMMRVKNGQTTILQENDVTMSNGTTILRDGTCIQKDGTKLTLKEGERMDMSGKIVPMKTNKDRNMYLVPDSTRNKDK